MSSHDIFEERRKALEEAFFAKRNQQLLQKLKSDMDASRKREVLKCASGIDDDALLDRLLKLGITTETLAAMTLAPLVIVAWADGKLNERERHAILSAAADEGVTHGSVCQHLLSDWLETAPEGEFFELWQSYVKALLRTLDADEQAKLRDAVLGRSHRVAKAAGGILRLGSISASEQAKLDEIAKAFAS